MWHLIKGITPYNDVSFLLTCNSRCIGILQKVVDQNNIYVTLPVSTWRFYIGGIHTFIKVFELKQWSQCTKFKINHCKLKFKNFKLLMQYFFKLSILYCKRHASNSSYNDRQYILKIQPKILIYRIYSKLIFSPWTPWSAMDIRSGLRGCM